MMENQDLVEIQSKGLVVAREPQEVLAEAKKAAQALMTVVSQKKNPVIINKEQYLEFEDWQTVGRFYGLTARVIRTSLIDLGGVMGYEASADVIRNSDGMIISSADSMCLNDEEKWSTRTKYEYKNILDGQGKKIWVEGANGKKGYYKSERIEVGTVPVPLFQLRSMAQTRACAKALRNVLAWVVVLAGFKPTVVEEMTGDEESDNSINGVQTKPDVQAPIAKSSGRVISEKQGTRLLDIAKEKGFSKEIVQEYAKNVFGFEHLRDITVDKYDEIVKHYEDSE